MKMSDLVKIVLVLVCLWDFGQAEYNYTDKQCK